MATERVRVSDDGNWRARLRVWADFCPALQHAGASVDVEQKTAGEWLSSAAKSISGRVSYRGATGVGSLGKDFELPLNRESESHAEVDIYSTPAGLVKDSGAPIGTVPLDVAEVIAESVEVLLPFVTSGSHRISFTEPVSCRKASAVDCIARYLSSLCRRRATNSPRSHGPWEGFTSLGRERMTTTE
jgi:hypothetical protein